VVAWPVLLAGSHLGAWAFHRAKPHYHRRISPTILSGLAMALIARAFGQD
jgi:uncharacterized membrane protein YfcA